MNIRTTRAVSKYLLATVGLIFLTLSVSGCVQNYKSAKTSMELQAIQAKNFETNKKIAFASTMSVFQDLGYTIGTADFDTGLITANSPTNQSQGLFTQNMTHIKATAFIETIGKFTKVRLNFVTALRTSTAYGMKGGNDSPIEDPIVYQNAFSKILKAIFIRTNT